MEIYTIVEYYSPPNSKFIKISLVRDGADVYKYIKCQCRCSIYFYSNFHFSSKLFSFKFTFSMSILFVNLQFMKTNFIITHVTFYSKIAKNPIRCVQPGATKAYSVTKALK